MTGCVQPSDKLHFGIHLEGAIIPRKAPKHIFILHDEQVTVKLSPIDSRDMNCIIWLLPLAVIVKSTRAMRNRIYNLSTQTELSTIATRIGDYNNLGRHHDAHDVLIGIGMVNRSTSSIPRTIHQRTSRYQHHLPPPINNLNITSFRSIAWCSTNRTSTMTFPTQNTHTSGSNVSYNQIASDTERKMEIRTRICFIALCISFVTLLVFYIGIKLRVYQ